MTLQTKRNEYASLASFSYACRLNVPSRLLNSTGAIPSDFSFVLAQDSALCNEEDVYIAGSVGYDPAEVVDDPCRTPCVSLEDSEAFCQSPQCLDRHIMLSEAAEEVKMPRSAFMETTMSRELSASLPCPAGAPRDSVDCYCSQRVSSAVAKAGVFLGPLQLLLLDVEPVCLSAARETFLGALLRIAATASVVVMSAVLRFVWTKLAKFERHDTVGASDWALVLKLFLGIFVNNSVVVLLAVSLLSVPFSFFFCSVL